MTYNKGRMEAFIPEAPAIWGVVSTKNLITKITQLNKHFKISVVKIIYNKNKK